MERPELSGGSAVSGCSIW